MTSVGCENRTTGALTGFVGVVSVAADHHTGQVRVSVDPSSSVEEMREAIEDLSNRVVS